MNILLHNNLRYTLRIAGYSTDLIGFLENVLCDLGFYCNLFNSHGMHET